MDLVDLKESFIPRCFVERVWEKLLVDLPGVCEPLIREFYANAILRNDYLDCWVRGHEFTLEVGHIDGVLGHGNLDQEEFTPFKEKNAFHRDGSIPYWCCQGRKMSQHNHLPFEFEMPHIHYVVQPISSKEDDHHQKCLSHLLHGAS